LYIFGREYKGSTRIVRFPGCFGLMVVSLLIAFGLSAAAARIIGLRQPNAAAAILQSVECAVPCWRGINPGTTLIEEASMLVRRNRELTAFTDTTGNPDTQMRQVCWAIKLWRDWQGCAVRAAGERGPVDRINIVPSNSLHFSLGEALVIFGEPLGASVCRGSRYLRLDIFFAHNVELYAFGNIHDPRIAPDMQVGLISYHFLSDEPPYPFDLPAWRGFTRLSDAPYC
jgi:hypothetical protein